MSDIPDTDNVAVAMIAAALKLAVASSNNFDTKLENFKKAYRVISLAVELNTQAKG